MSHPLESSCRQITSVTVAKVAGMGMVWFPDFGWVNNLTGIGIRPSEVTYDIQLIPRFTRQQLFHGVCVDLYGMYLYVLQNIVQMVSH